MTTLTQPIKWHGGKSYLAAGIIDRMPPRCANPNAPAADDSGWCHYVEPYFGGGAVLLANDPEGISEVVNDIDGRLINFWHCLAHAPSFTLFQRAAEALAFCESTWECALRRLERPCETPDCICIACATAFFVACRQSLAGRMDSFAPLSRNRTRRGMNEQASAWLNAVEGLPAVHARLRRVVILGPKPALDVIEQQDGPLTLFYLDPPYLDETRTSPDVYHHEMTEADHVNLLSLLRTIKGRFMLSGYRSRLYDNFAAVAGWNREDFDLPNNAAGGVTKRRMTECLWKNY